MAFLLNGFSEMFKSVLTRIYSILELDENRRTFQSNRTELEVHTSSTVISFFIAIISSTETSFSIAIISSTVIPLSICRTFN